MRESLEQALGDVDDQAARLAADDKSKRHEVAVLENEKVARRIGLHREDVPAPRAVELHDLAADQVVHKERLWVVESGCEQHSTTQLVSCLTTVDAFELHQPPSLKRPRLANLQNANGRLSVICRRGGR